MSKRVIIGYDDLQTKYPDLAKEWHPTKNGSLTPENVTCGSRKKIWWIGLCGHEWQSAISSRVNGTGCPYCCNQKILAGYNDLATAYPQLAEEWDYEKNIVLPSEVSKASSKRVWWKCKNGHSYEMTVGNRTKNNGNGCPYCSVPAKKVLKGYNDLQTKYPDLAKEWHPVKNGKLTPDNVLCGTEKMVWWICKNGHEYEQRIVSRVKGGNCPYCSHQKLLTGYNDFSTEHPELLCEWDNENNSIKPTAIMSNSHYKAWWKCPFGHSYQSWMSSRCGPMHSGCPHCDKENHTSFPEQALYYYIKQCFPDSINSEKNVIGMELDIYIPTVKTAIEYDGRNWHKNNKSELKKNEICHQKNIRLIRIREEGLTFYDDCLCLERKNVRSDNSLSEVIRKLMDILHCATDVDVVRDSAMIYSFYISTRKAHSLETKYPDLVKEWHPTKNGSLTPEMVSPMTNKLVWWIGQCGHEWQMSISDRTGQNCGCPICSGKRIISGINDLLSGYPMLCEEWDFERNAKAGIYPNKVAPHSDKKAWWKCSVCGYEWLSKIDGRTRMKAGCPQCGKRLISESKYKPVRCIETGNEYTSLQDAEEKTGISRHCISNCCKGKQKTAGKHRWEYII